MSQTGDLFKIKNHMTKNNNKIVSKITFENISNI